MKSATNQSTAERGWAKLMWRAAPVSLYSALAIAIIIFVIVISLTVINHQYQLNITKITSDSMFMMIWYDKYHFSINLTFLPTSQNSKNQIADQHNSEEPGIVFNNLSKTNLSGGLLRSYLVTDVGIVDAYQNSAPRNHLQFFTSKYTSHVYNIKKISAHPQPTLNKGEICPSRRSRRECKLFASSLNFSRNNAIYNINESTKYVLSWLHL